MDADRGHARHGAVISPLLANIYLHPLDALMANKGYRMVRLMLTISWFYARAPERRTQHWRKSRSG